MAENKKQKGNLDMETVMQGTTEDQSSSTDAFFDALENDVNSAITHDNSTDKEQVTPQAQAKDPSDTGNSGETVEETQAELSTDWEKRYSDSSREAQRLNAELKELQPLQPLLEVMKKDPNLIPYIKDYLEQGGKPNQSVQDKLKLDEDFVFDSHEAVTNPDSDSAKVMNHMVNEQVNNRMQKHLAAERQRVNAARAKNELHKAEVDFKKRHKLTDEQFKDFQEKAKGHRMTLDDAFYLVNRDKVQQNVANASKEETLRQMKNVREIPTSQASTNNAGEVKKSEGDKILDVLKDLDGGVDGLFG
tara:strand:- start:224 stop:1135 length:912 start_codon:yes stop_codon:yes gene_type:complete